MHEGVEGLLRDKTRPVAHPAAAARERRTGRGPDLGEPPGETTHWTAPAMAKAVGVSLTSVQRIWRAHGLQPHRMRTFKLSNDPQVRRRSSRTSSASTSIRRPMPWSSVDR